MKKTLPVAVILLLSACTVPRQASVSSVDANSGIVRLSYGQAVLQSATTDSYVANGMATKQCQQMGYATAFAYGQPEATCTTISGSLCLNHTITLQYQCRGVTVTPMTSTSSYW